VLSGLAAKFPALALVRSHGPAPGPDPAQPASVDWVPGAFAFIPSDLFAHLNGFDERFFLYYEEVDLCRPHPGCRLPHQ